MVEPNRHHYTVWSVLGGGDAFGPGRRERVPLGGHHLQRRPFVSQSAVVRETGRGLALNSWAGAGSGFSSCPWATSRSQTLTRRLVMYARVEPGRSSSSSPTVSSMGRCCGWGQRLGSTPPRIDGSQVALP